MNINRIGVLLVTVAAAGATRTETLADERTQIELNVHMEVLTRGPVHEAYAEVVTFDPQPGLVVTQAPPDLIEEVPPDQRPEGENIVWVPGYPAWDDERDDYIWVSGVWREVPPDRQWVPGYWARTDVGFQWTYGYWADVEAAEIEYLPEPPAVIEEVAIVEAPSPDYTWIPGYWTWQTGRYVWRPGRWVVVQADWDWVPARYVWTPRGHIFVEGYWDYTVARRGVLFAPVHFDTVVYERPGFSYSPATVIDVDLLTEHLFVRTSHSHYYFGDYYEVGYHDAGFVPSFSFSVSRGGYDPIYARARWEHRHDHDWERRVEASFVYRRNNAAARPPRTFSAQLQLTASLGDVDRKALTLAKPLAVVAKSQGGTTRFRQVELEERKSLMVRGREIGKFRAERRKLETQPPELPSDWSSAGTARGKVRLPGSPIAAKSAAISKSRVPTRLQAPEPDLSVEPKPRKPILTRDGQNGDSMRRSKGPRRELDRGNLRRPPQAKPRPTTDSRPKAAPQDEAGGGSTKETDHPSNNKPKADKDKVKAEPATKAKVEPNSKQKTKSKKKNP